MRIAIAGQTYYPGNNGQAIFTIHLAEGLARDGHDVHMLVPSPRFQYRVEEIHGVHVHFVRSINFGWVHPEAFFPFLVAGEVSQVFKRARPDVIHIQDHYFLSWEVVRIARRMKIPVMGTNHFLPENVLPYLNLLPLPRKGKIQLMWSLMLWTYNLLDRVTTPTETAANILRRQKIHVPVSAISCGVNTDFFHPNPGLNRAEVCASLGLDASKVMVLYVGRLDGEKRIDLLLRALAKLRQSGRDDIHLAIAGQGAAGNDLRSLAHSLGLEKQVRFLGYVPNEVLPRLYQVGHIFAMPSPEELQSIATLEAMASGRPVLAARARALPELVTHLGNGYLFEPGQVEAVAQGMAYLADHRADWERMGAASRAKAQTHSVANTIKKYTAMYRSLAGERETEEELPVVESVRSE